MQGFLGTGATFLADLNLIIQILMGVALLFGMSLARRGKYTAHGFCQSMVVILNLVMITLIMVPSFRKQVIPQIPAGLKDPYYGVAAAHGFTGIVTILLAAYVVLVATKVMPAALRFQNYKRWMRTTLTLWWLVILGGIGIYYYWYIAEPAQAKVATETKPETGPTAANRVTIEFQNFEFKPKELTIPVGTTVEWIGVGGRHSIEADDGSFKSDPKVTGDKFEHTFTKAGTYPYYCGFHGDKGGKDMAGVIKVVPK